MKYCLILFALCLPLAAQQSFDFKTLDRLGANARNSTNVTLDHSMLKLASNFLDNDQDSAQVKALIRNLKSITVRNYDFEKPGQYNDADLAPLRAFLKQPPWNRIVETKGVDDSTEIYVQPMPNDKVGGVAILSVAPKSLTVVYIDGTLSTDDIGKLSGNMGIPKLKLPKEAKTPPRED